MSKSIRVHEMLLKKDPEKYRKLLDIRKEMEVPITEKIKTLKDMIENKNKVIDELRERAESSEHNFGEQLKEIKDLKQQIMENNETIEELKETINEMNIEEKTESEDKENGE